MTILKNRYLAKLLVVGFRPLGGEFTVIATVPVLPGMIPLVEIIVTLLMTFCGSTITLLRFCALQNLIIVFFNIFF